MMEVVVAVVGEGKRAWIDVGIFIKALWWLWRCCSVVVRVWRRSKVSICLVMVQGLNAKGRAYANELPVVICMLA